jgi:hypothetical protein
MKAILYIRCGLPDALEFMTSKTFTKGRRSPDAGSRDFHRCARVAAIQVTEAPGSHHRRCGFAGNTLNLSQAAALVLGVEFARFRHIVARTQGNPYPLNPDREHQHDVEGIDSNREAGDSQTAGKIFHRTHE